MASLGLLRVVGVASDGMYKADKASDKVEVDHGGGAPGQLVCPRALVVCNYLLACYVPRWTYPQAKQWGTLIPHL